MPSDRHSSSARVRPAPSESDKDEIEQKTPQRDRRREEKNGRSRDVEAGDSRGRDKDKKKDKSAGASSGSCWQRALLAILFFCGPVGTVISFLLLPKDAETSEQIRANAMGNQPSPDSSGGGGLRVRMVHLSLADTDRRARFVLDENTVWDTFLAGCRERLQVQNIRKVTDSSGEAILAVEDLVHDDHLVIYATPAPPGSDSAPPLPAADDLGPAEVSLPAISAAIVGSRSRLVQPDDSSADEAVNASAAGAAGTGPNGEGGGGSSSEQAVVHSGRGDDDGAEHHEARAGGSRSHNVNQLSALASATAAAGIGAAAAEDDAADDGAARGAPAVGQGPIDGASYAAQVLANARAEDDKQRLGGGHAHPHAAAPHGGAHGGAEHSSSSSGGSSSAAAGTGAGAGGAAAGGGSSDGGVGHDGGSHHDGGAHHGHGHGERRGHGEHMDGLGHEDDLLYDQENPSRPCGKHHPSFRIAMLIPWVNELPPWLSYFVATAQRSEYLIDWLVFHETLSPPRNLPSNVKFIDLGAGGLSQLIGLKMGEELGMPVRNASLLIRSMRFMLEKWPRLVAEYKPAFGSVFEQYLGNEYTHWGYW